MACARAAAGCPAPLPAAGLRRPPGPVYSRGHRPAATYEEIYTHLLPESDVLALQQGVYLANEAELQQRLEDYGL